MGFSWGSAQELVKLEEEGGGDCSIPALKMIRTRSWRNVIIPFTSNSTAISTAVLNIVAVLHAPIVSTISLVNNIFLPVPKYLCHLEAYF